MKFNRGNLSKIFGELMLLIEKDKRIEADNNQDRWTTTLMYSRPEEPRFYLPANIYLLGMMNTADRSLSIVDYAFRRRFSFVALEPMFGSKKFSATLKERSVPESDIEMIVSRMTELNNAIVADRLNLGPGYRIGHSFFVPSTDFEYDPGWYQRVIESEIYPLLEQYWFDDSDKVESWHAKLLQGAV
jgi:hypothetical protein